MLAPQLVPTSRITTFSRRLQEPETKMWFVGTGLGKFHWSANEEDALRLTQAGAKLFSEMLFAHTMTKTAVA